MMKHLSRLLLAALLVVPLVACDEDDGGTTTPTISGTIRGTVSVEGNPVSGVNVQLAGAASQSVTTGSDGTFEFAGVPEGSYSVSISGAPAGVTFSTPSKTTSITTNGQTVTVDFSGSYIRTSSISGTVSAGGGVEGATVTLSGTESGTTTTDSNGSYSFSGLRAGQYTVEVSNLPEGVTIGTTSKNVTLSAGQSATVNFSGQGTSTAKVVIERMTAGNTNAPINTGNAGGQIDVTLKIDEGNDNVNRAALLVDGEEVAFQTFASGSTAGPGMNVAQAPEAVEGEFTVVFSWSSHAIVRDDQGNPVPDENGMAQAKHSDGLKSVTAVIDSDNGGQSSAQTGTQITLNNSAGGFVGNAVGNTVLVQVSTDVQAIGNGGLLWNGGTVEATAMPLDYDGNVSAQATITLQDNGGFGASAKTDTDGSDGFTATWSDAAVFASGGVSNVQTGNFGGIPGVDFDVATITQGGATGPGVLGANPIHLDNVPGTINGMNTLVRSTRWARAEWEFGVNGTNIDGTAQPTATDPGGSGFKSATFWAGTSQGNLMQVTTGDDLDESFNADTYLLQVQTEDQVGNVFSSFYAGPGDGNDVGEAELGAGVTAANVDSDPDALIGIDKGAPSASLATGAPNLTDEAVMNTTGAAPGGTIIDQINVNSSDTRSGFPPNRVMWKTVFMAPGASGQTTCAIGTWTAAGTCTHIARGTTFDFSAGPFNNGHTLGEGYYMTELWVEDAAGNASDPITLLNLRDVTGPNNGGLTHDPNLTPGGTETFGSPGTDNVDIDGGQLFLRYNGPGGNLGFVFQDDTEFGAFGPDAYTTSGTVNVTTEFLGAIENTLGGGISPADQARIDLFDFALGVTTNVSTQTSTFGAGVNPYSTTPPNSWGAAARQPDGQILTSSANTSDGNATICGDGDNDGCSVEETSATANFVVTGEGSANNDGELTNQFQEVVFQTEIGAPGSGLWKNIGTGTVTITEAGDTRTFTYSGTIQASSFDNAGGAVYTVRAIGINTTEGFGLMETFTITISDE